MVDNRSPYYTKDDNHKKSLEATCDSTTCAYRGKGICDFKEGEFCPMYKSKKNSNG